MAMRTTLVTGFPHLDGSYAWQALQRVLVSRYIRILVQAPVAAPCAGGHGNSAVWRLPECQFASNIRALLDGADCAPSLLLIQICGAWHTEHSTEHSSEQP